MFIHLSLIRNTVSKVKMHGIDFVCSLRQKIFQLSGHNLGFVKRFYENIIKIHLLELNPRPSAPRAALFTDAFVSRTFKTPSCLFVQPRYV